MYIHTDTDKVYSRWLVRCDIYLALSQWDWYLCHGVLLVDCCAFPGVPLLFEDSLVQTLFIPPYSSMSMALIPPCTSWRSLYTQCSARKSCVIWPSCIIVSYFFFISSCWATSFHWALVHLTAQIETSPGKKEAVIITEFKKYYRINTPCSIWRASWS